MASILMPRGVRNNNPGNIRLSNIRWQGQRQTGLSDRDFVEFSSPVFGVRALMLVLLNYYLKYRLDTVEAIINRYAPPCENATDNYIGQVCQTLKVARRTRLNLLDADMLTMLAKAIVRHENGKPPSDIPHYWYDDTAYGEAAQMALERKK